MSDPESHPISSCHYIFVCTWHQQVVHVEARLYDDATAFSSMDCTWQRTQRVMLSMMDCVGYQAETLVIGSRHLVTRELNAFYMTKDDVDQALSRTFGSCNHPIRLPLQSLSTSTTTNTITPGFAKTNPRRQVDGTILYEVAIP